MEEESLSEFVRVFNTIELRLFYRMKKEMVICFLNKMKDICVCFEI